MIFDFREKKREKEFSKFFSFPFDFLLFTFYFLILYSLFFSRKAKNQKYLAEIKYFFHENFFIVFKISFSCLQFLIFVFGEKKREKEISEFLIYFLLLFFTFWFLYFLSFSLEKQKIKNTLQNKNTFSWKYFHCFKNFFFTFTIFDFCFWREKERKRKFQISISIFFGLLIFWFLLSKNRICWSKNQLIKKSRFVDQKI